MTHTETYDAGETYKAGDLVRLIGMTPAWSQEWQRHIRNGMVLRVEAVDSRDDVFGGYLVRCSPLSKPEKPWPSRELFCEAKYFEKL